MAICLYVFVIPLRTARTRLGCSVVLTAIDVICFWKGLSWICCTHYAIDGDGLP